MTSPTSDFRKIDLPGDFWITRSGEVKTSKKPLKPRIGLKGCRIRLGKKMYVINDLVEKTFGRHPDPLGATEQILKTVSFIKLNRLMWKRKDQKILVKVLYQSSGLLEREEFALTNPVDAALIFNPLSPFVNKWTRVYTKPRRSCDR